MLDGIKKRIEALEKRKKPLGVCIVVVRELEYDAPPGVVVVHLVRRKRYSSLADCGNSPELLAKAPLIAEYYQDARYD